MAARGGLLAGPVAAILLLAGLFVLPAMVPGYDPVRQTVSEIGEAGSPMRWPFTLLLTAIALLLAIFGIAVRSTQDGAASVGGGLICVMAAAVFGVGLFAYPHPMHNLFGLLEIPGYAAPFALAGWRRNLPVARWSAVCALLVGASLIANLAHAGMLGQDANLAFDRLAAGRFGLVQRSLFAAWFGWCVGLGILMKGQAA